MFIQQVEQAADEIARLDQVAAQAPLAVGVVLRLGVVAQTSPDPETDLRRLLAAEVDPFHEDALPATPRGWRDLLAEEARRVRGGAFPSLDRAATLVPSLATYPARPRLEAAWRDAAPGTASLARALDAAAWAPDAAVGEALAALLLVLGGRTDQLRFRPFHGVEAAERGTAIAAWRSGDEGPWTLAGLSAASRTARRLRERIIAVVAGMPAEEARLDALGRGAITARRALAQLRHAPAMTMPILAEDLGCSRPAAADALARLEAHGLARELTGRARDRVWVYAPALALALAGD